MSEHLGKISRVKFGIGGYQDAMFGISVDLDMKGSGVGDFKGTWSLKTKVTGNTKWTEQDRTKIFDETMRYINQLLIDANVDDIDKLKGVPVMVTIENNMLKSWRILTEVI